MKNIYENSPLDKSANAHSDSTIKCDLHMNSTSTDSCDSHMNRASTDQLPSAGKQLKIVTVRRISQIFFLLLFFWFSISATLGTNWWQLRGWPVNWFLELDPLVGLSTLLTTGTIYKGLIWGVATVVFTLIFGRFFCGWLCPFGTMHQAIGSLGKIGRSKRELHRLNRYRPAQSIKYAILLFFIASTISAPLLSTTSQLLTGLLDPIPFVYRLVNLTMLPFADNALLHLSANPRFYNGAWIIGTLGILSLLINIWIPRFYCRYICPLGALFGWISTISFWQIGKKSSPCRRCLRCQFHCEGACEPMESIRISECVMCMNCLDQCSFLTYQAAPSRCEKEPFSIKGERAPSGGKYGGQSDGEESSLSSINNEERELSLSGSREHSMPDISRRTFVASVVAGATVIPMMSLNGTTESNWNPNLIRPPGALPERQFLSRCIKCGQCMRICPTNVIQPADILTGGFEGLWTPALNFRIGSSGCQLHCIACGHICPTGAILPLDLDQRVGINDHAQKGAIKIGTAFVDQGRCLPWAMNRPCIVCQENCPVSPKAIVVSEAFVTLKSAAIDALPEAMPSSESLSDEKRSSGSKDADGKKIILLDRSDLIQGEYATGDYFVREINSSARGAIVANSVNSVTISPQSTDGNEPGLRVGSKIAIEVRLQRPLIDPVRCIGCGVCEHECPVKGKRAIRVSAENESRSRSHVLIG